MQVLCLYSSSLQVCLNECDSRALQLQHLSGVHCREARCPLYQEDLLLSSKVILIPKCGPPSQTLPFSPSAKSIYLSVGLARLSSGLICLFVSVPRASAACRVACKVLTQTRPPSRPVKPPTFSVTRAPAAAADGGPRCKLTDHKQNKKCG